MNTVYLNGTYLPENEAKIPISDRSYQFGEGAFESFRSYDGEFPFLNSHLERLEMSATVLGFHFPSDISFSEVCRTLLEKNDLENARFKILLSRSHDNAENPEVNLAVYCSAIDKAKVPESYKLRVIQSVQNDQAMLCSIKSTSRLCKVMGLIEAQESGCDDGILLNAKGQVTECTRGNIFWVDETNHLHTVFPECGILGGITRQELLKVLKENDLKFSESVITPEELKAMPEVFETNAVVGIMPVTEIDGEKIDDGEPGNITLMIRDLWKKKIEGLISS